MINVRILSMAIRMFFMANLYYAAAAGASCAGKRLLYCVLCVGGPLTDGDGGALRRCWHTPGRCLASRKAKMFWTSERVNWREEATGVGARKRSTAAIHAAKGGTGTRAGTCVVNGATETFVCMGTGTGVRVSARTGACAGGCTDP